MDSPHASPEPAPANLGELALTLVRARVRVAACTAAGLTLALVACLLVRPSFRASATILIEQESASSLLGDLASLASMSAAPATASELSVLESRTLAELVLAEGSDEQGAWAPFDEKSVGLTTLVDDEAVTPTALVRRKLFDRPPPDEPLVLPARTLVARVTSTTSDAPTRVQLEFLGEQRVRISTLGFLQRLHLAGRSTEEHAFAPRAPISYRGLVLELEPGGDYGSASFVVEHLPHHEALRRMQERLEVQETALNSGVIEVAFEDTDPRRAARTVNALCRRYLDALATRGQRRASKTVDYVQGLLDEEVTRFDRAQDDIMRLQQQSPELISPDGTATSLIEQMSTLEVERVQLELSQHAFSEIVAALEAGDRRALARIDSTLNVGVLVDPVTTGLLAEIARLDAQDGTLGTDLLDNHPLRARNAAATADLLARTRAQLASRMEGVRTRAEELARIEEELRERLAKMPENLRQLTEARVEIGLHRELVPYLIQSLQSAEIMRASAETWAELVDPAVPPDELESPDFLRIGLLGALLGLAAGMTLAFTREPARGRVHGAAELASALGVEPVVVLRRLDGPELVFRTARTSAAAEAIRALRASLRFGPAGGARRVVGVAPLGARALGATLAAELAQAFTSEGRRTLLVEAESGAAARFDAGPGKALGEGAGLAEHLEADQPWRELVRHTSGGPDVLLAGKSGAHAGDLLARATAERFVAEAAAAYDAVVVALPEAGTLVALAGFLRALDVLCLVHPARTLARARVAEVARSLRAAGARALVGVLVERTSRETRPLEKVP